MDGEHCEVQNKNIGGPGKIWILHVKAKNDENVGS